VELALGGEVPDGDGRQIPRPAEVCHGWMLGYSAPRARRTPSLACARRRALGKDVPSSGGEPLGRELESLGELAAFLVIFSALLLFLLEPALALWQRTREVGSVWVATIVAQAILVWLGAIADVYLFARRLHRERRD
jgi:hypothetical protein